MQEVKLVDGKYYFNNALIDVGINYVCNMENFIVVKYGSKNSIFRVLSNLYPVHFIFKHKNIRYIESVLQDIKYQNKKTQNKVFKYSRVDI